MPPLSWRSHLRPVALDDEQLLLLGELQHHVLSGSIYANAAQWFGSPSPDKGSSEQPIPAQRIPFQVELTLGHLEALGLVCDAQAEAATSLAPSEIAYWHSLKAKAADVATRLSQNRVSIVSCSSDIAALTTAFEIAHIRVVPSDTCHDLVVVVADDYLESELAFFNRRQLACGQRWLLVKLVGSVIWLGPLFIPGQTACWECLAQRLSFNRQLQQVLATRLDQVVAPPVPKTKWSMRLAAQFVATEVARMLGIDSTEGLASKLTTLDLKSGDLRRHTVIRRAQCRECGGTAKQPRGTTVSMRAEWMQPGNVKPPAGNVRQWSADAVLCRFAHHISPLTGVVHELVETQVDGVSQVVAPHSFPLHRYDFHALRDNLLGRSGGKGLRGLDGRAIALCEALERYSGVWSGDEPSIVASRAELRDAAIGLNDCLRFSARQFSDRDRLNAANDDPHAWIPHPLDADDPIAWVEAQSLTTGERRFLPAAYCYYGHPDLQRGFTFADSNGCAAGASLAEAAAFALLELVERDAAGIWWFNRLRRTAVDLDSCSLPLVHELRDLYAKRGRPFWVLDLTSDLGVPVMAAISARQMETFQDIIYGFGADFSAESALERAVLEMNQSYYLVAASHGSGGRYRTDRKSTCRWFREATLSNQPYLVPDRGQHERKLSQFPQLNSSSWEDTVMRTVARLHHKRLETLILDQTRQDIGLPVCRVVVPGLCHIWRRLGAARLYDVPIAMGWLKTPCEEKALNELPVYF
jgi:oxazoline/thiazoline synthase